MSDWWQSSLNSLQQGIAAGDISAGELEHLARSRIDDLDAALGAFTSIDPDAGLFLASNYEQLPLRGIPITVKELIAVKGRPHTGQSLTRSGVTAKDDAAVVAAMRSLGACVVGTTRTHELAFGITTQHESLGGTKNPWNLDYTPGGSSGGSAAAVATGMVPFALGSDTACSVRLPAALCGICGFRPTHGSLPVDGVIPLAPSVDTVGFLAREVDDIAYVWSALQGLESPGLRPIEMSQIRIGVARLQPSDLIAKSQRTCFEKATGQLRYRTTDVDWPHDIGVMESYGSVTGVETMHVHKNVLRSWPAKSASYGSDVRTRLAAIEERGDRGLKEAQRSIDEYSEIWAGALERVDVVLLPASGGGASLVSDPDFVMIDDERVDFRYAVFPWQVSVSLLGVPSCVIPAGIDENGIPIGIQVIGKRNDDALVLQVAAEIRDELRSALPVWPTTVV